MTYRQTHTIKRGFTMSNELTVATSTRLAAFEQRAVQTHHHEPSTVWTPAEGDTVLGIIIGVEPVNHPTFGQQFQLCVRDKTGSVIRVWLSKYLQNGLLMKNAQPDDLVAITFQGKRKTSRGSDYNSYQLTIEKA